jgi:hypothetical protein
MYASAIWLAARDANGALHTAGQNYRQRGNDFWSGRIKDDGTIDKITCAAEDKMYTVYGHEINEARAGRNIAYNISRWSNSFAPFYDKNGDGIYDPSLGDYPVYDLAHPEIVPGQMVWSVINDIGNEHLSYPNGTPIGVEIQVFAIAFASSQSEIINNSTIYKYQIQNKSSNNYPVFRFGEWADFDIGGFSDDFLGCDLSTNVSGRKRNLAYAYNSDNLDEDSNGKLGYGVGPPAIGLAYLNTGKKADGSPYQVATYICFNDIDGPSIGDPRYEGLDLEFYLRGFLSRTQAINYGDIGQTPSFVYPFMFPGTTGPIGSAPWYDSFPKGDRTATFALEPRSLTAGEQITIELAYLWARDSLAGNLASLEKLKRGTDTLITAHENFFANFSTGIANVKTKALLIYPNPSSDLLYIEGVTEAEELVIYASNGKVIMRERISAQQALNISSLADGIYFVRAGDYTGKFVKQ